MIDVKLRDCATPAAVEAHATFTNTADLMIGDHLSAEQRGRFHRRTFTSKVTNLRMSNVTLYPALGLVFKGNTAVEPTRYCVFAGEEAAALQRLAGSHQRLEGRCAFIGLNRCWSNYFHVLTQLVPAIAGYQGEPGFREGVLCVGGGSPLLFRALTLAGVDLPEIAMLHPTIPIDIGDLTFSHLLTGYDGPSLFCRSVFDRMIEHASSGTIYGGANSPRMIYIWRADSQARKLQNEDDLVDMLLRYGVEPVILSGLTMDEQITLFQNTRLVIGPHGAGLSNVVFCSPGAVLYELLPEHYVNACMYDLAQMRGLHYWCDIHKAENLPGIWRHQVPWSVDIDVTERRLVEILSYYRLD
jgi:Glycosyltransferase 61